MRALVAATPCELVYIGPPLGRRPHATAAPRLLLGLDAPFTLTLGEQITGPLRSAYVRPRQSNRVGGQASWWAVAYLAPGSDRDQSCQTAMQRVDGSVLIDHRNDSRLLALADSHQPDPAAVLNALGPTGYTHADPRVATSVTQLLDDPAHRRPASAAAADIGLSVWQFQRLFTRETGTTYRRFQQWLRLMETTRRLAAGHSLTDASIAAGFASSSHFSDTVRGLFGFTATELRATGATFTAIELT